MDRTAAHSRRRRDALQVHIHRRRARVPRGTSRHSTHRLHAHRVVRRRRGRIAGGRCPRTKHRRAERHAEGAKSSVQTRAFRSRLDRPGSRQSVRPVARTGKGDLSVPTWTSTVFDHRGRAVSRLETATGLVLEPRRGRLDINLVRSSSRFAPPFARAVLRSAIFTSRPFADSTTASCLPAGRRRTTPRSPAPPGRRRGRAAMSSRSSRHSSVRRGFQSTFRAASDSSPWPRSCTAWRRANRVARRAIWLRNDVHFQSGGFRRGLTRKAIRAHRARHGVPR